MTGKQAATAAPTEITLSEAGIRLSMTWPQVHAALLRGDLRGRKVGASWMLEEESVRTLEESRLEKLDS